MNQSPLTETGLVVSDLHIFGASSLYPRHLDALCHMARQYKILVLNGDTFDFKRSRFGSSNETAKHSLQWLSSLCSSAPETTIHYIVGNHDCQPVLIRGISELSSSHANLHLHEFSLRIAHSIFVHGDILDAHQTGRSLQSIRLSYGELEPSYASKFLGHIVTYLRLNAVEYLRNNKHNVVPRLADTLKTAIPDQLIGITSVYFGHTHVPFRNFTFEGITYHNTGSLIRGLRWMPLEFPLS